jgi:hypothetical protein
MAALEDAAAGRVAAGLAGEAAALGELAARLWVRAYGDLDAAAGPGLDALLAALRTRVDGALDATAADAGPAVRAAARDAFALGVRQGREQLPAPDRPPGALRPDAGAVEGAARTAARIVAGHREAAAAVLRPEVVERAGYPAVVAGVGQVRRAAVRLDGHVRTVVVAQTAGGVRAAAEAAGVGVLWVAERDGCLHCAAYAGVVAGADGAFPADLTFADRPLPPPPATGPDGRAHPTRTAAVRGPPRHPRCRCQLSPYSPEDDGPYARALRREARRAVLKGWSRPSESGAARLRAADRLLHAGVTLPASVQAEARRAVARGRFTSRRVPTGPPA